MRLQPQGGTAPSPDRVYCMPVELPGGSFLAVLFSFGAADEDAMADWKPVWRDVAGPVTREEVEELGRELAKR